MNEESIKKTVSDLVETIGVTRPDIVRYCLCYNIDYKSFTKKRQEYFGLYLELYLESYEFLLSKKNEIIKFRNDFFKFKTVKYLCEQLVITITEFVDFYNQHIETILYHGYTLKPKFYPTNVLTMDTKLGYISTKLLIHLYNGFPLKTTRNEEPNLNTQTIGVEMNNGFNKIIGYDDFKLSVIDQLSPIMDSKALDLWGLRAPGGIILFGPPGCGKTFWAEQIAQYLNFQFFELPRSMFASSLVDGAVKNLKEILDKTESKTVLFFDEFDSVAETRSIDTSGSRENVKLVNTLLQEIPKLIKKEVVILAATNYLSRIDSAVIRPGRFDLKIPIFPPNNEERAKLIFYYLRKNLNQKSPLLTIIRNNTIDSPDFFSKYSNDMILFSTSLIEDFVDTLKRSLKLEYDTGQDLNDIIIDETRIKECLSKTKAKLVKQDLEFIANFYLEINSFTGAKIYEKRLKGLKSELQKMFKDDKDPPRPIGFRMPKVID